MNEDNTRRNTPSAAAKTTDVSVRAVRGVGLGLLLLLSLACNWYSPSSCAKRVVQSAEERVAEEVEERVGAAVEGAVREVTDPIVDEGVRRVGAAAGIHLPDGSKAENPISLFDMSLEPFGTGQAKLSITAGETTILEERARAADGTVQIKLTQGNNVQTYLMKGDKTFVIAQDRCLALGQAVSMPEESQSALPLLSPLMGIYTVLMREGFDRSQLVAAGTEQLGPIATTKKTVTFDTALIVARAQGNAQAWFDNQDRVIKSNGSGFLIGQADQREPLNFEFERSRLGENIEIEVPDSCSFATTVTANGVTPGGQAPEGTAGTTLYALPAPNGVPAHMQTAGMRGFLVNDMSVEEAKAFYRSELEGRGFTESMKLENDGTSIVTFQKDGESITVTVSRTEPTTQVILAQSS